ncbi:MAG: glycosyltransferase family 4 protein, partial [Candidatus Omnitrophica bacterium]|nr:glycosyltransferase family 4 protein [Candidatus Omnitrophota bacterium]
FKFYDRQNIKKYNLVLCNSFYSKEYIKRAYRIEARVHYLGTDTEKFRPLDNVNKENVVISVGHLEPRKGHDFLIYVLARISSFLRPRMVIVYPYDSEWHKEYGRYLQELAQKNKVEIDLFSGISDEELVNLYNRAKLTLCAFFREPFGLVPLESMACGTPVVAVKEGGLMESVAHNKTGVLVDRDIDKFSQAVDYLLRNDKIREEMGKIGRQYVLERWHWDISVKALHKVFLELINNG